MKSIVVDWGAFWGRCPYFTSNTRILGGYGCRHKDVEIGRDDERGTARGACATWCCPITWTVEREDADNPNVDPNGFDLSEASDGEADDDLVRVPVDPDDEGYQHALCCGLLPVEVPPLQTEIQLPPIDMAIHLPAVNTPKVPFEKALASALAQSMMLGNFLQSKGFDYIGLALEPEVPDA